MRPKNFSDSFVFCSRMFCFILQTSACFRWVSLTYNHSVVSTVCWNAVTSVKNISSCGPQKSTVIVSFLWSAVQCLLRTDHNKKVKPPVSRAPISKETVFRKIYFIFADAETIIKCFSKGVIYRPVLHLYAIAYLFSVRYCEIVLADRLTYLFSVRYCEIVLADRLTTLQKVPMICFCFNIAKRPLR